MSHSHSNANNLAAILFIRAFLVDCLMHQNVSLAAIKLSKLTWSESILINLQSISCSTTFCYFIL